MTSIRSVFERETPSETFGTPNQLVANVDYYFDESTDSIYRINSDGTPKSFKSGMGTVRVTYNAGYPECPADLKLAVIDLITYYHKDEHKLRQTIAGASIQNSASTSQRGNVGFPDQHKKSFGLI